MLNREDRFLQGYNAKARAVLVALLDKYRLAGVGELANPEVFRLEPFRDMGQAPGVIRRFGGPAGLKRALAELQRRLYEGG